MGFRVPLAEWFRGALKQQVSTRLQNERMQQSGLFNMQTIALWLKEHESGQSDHSTAIWTLLMFENFLSQAA